MARATVALLAAALLMATWAPPAGAELSLGELQQRINKERQTLQELQRRSESVKAQLNSVLRREKATAGELYRLQVAIAEKEQRLRQLQGELEEATRLLREAEGRLREAEAHLARRTDLMERRVRALYEHGLVGYLDVVLGATDFGDFLTRAESLRLVIAGDISLFHQVRLYRDLTERLRQEREQERARVMAAKEAVEETRQHLELQKEEQQDRLQKLLSDREALEKALDELDALSRDVEGRIRRYTKEYESRLRSLGALVLEAPVSGPVSSGFGMRFHPILRKSRMHNGIDYAVPYGTPVRAAERGVVFLADWLGGYGNAVILMHGKSVSTLYAHMSRLAVSQGREVAKGEVLGYVGSTGLSTGPHLHFEVRINGEPQNPAAYLGRVIQ